MSESIKGRAVRGIVWSSIDKFSVQGIQFFLMLILARLLAPSDYGMMSILAIFLTISQSIIDGGFVSALIRKKDRSDIDLSTVFYFNIVIGLVLTLALYLAAPLIGSFYNMPRLIPITRVVSFVLLIKSCSIVPIAILTVRLDFKTQTKASLISVLVGGVLGVSAAYKGLGVWSLVIQAVSLSIINTLILLLLTKWKPLLIFSFTSFKKLWSFGSKLLLSSLIDVTYRNIFPIVIGKKFDAASLGYYSRADQFAQLPSANITNILQRVTFPVFSEIQDDNKRLKDIYVRFLRLSAYLIFPLMMGLAALANPLILLILTEKWLPVVLLLQILCFSQMWYPVHAINLNLLQVKGYSGVFLKLEIVKKAIGISILIITVPLGIIAMCIGSIASSLISLIINTYYTGKIIDMGFFKQMKVLLPSLFYALSMGGIVYFITLIVDAPLLQILVGLVVGLVYFFSISYITKSIDLKELQLILKRKRNG